MRIIKIVATSQPFQIILPLSYARIGPCSVLTSPSHSPSKPPFRLFNPFGTWGTEVVISCETEVSGGLAGLIFWKYPFFAYIITFSHSHTNASQRSLAARYTAIPRGIYGGSWLGLFWSREGEPASSLCQAFKKYGFFSRPENNPTLGDEDLVVGNGPGSSPSKSLPVSTVAVSCIHGFINLYTSMVFSLNGINRTFRFGEVQLQRFASANSDPPRDSASRQPPKKRFGSLFNIWCLESLCK